MVFTYPHRKEDVVASVPTKVLVVDDDPDLQEILGICLRHIWRFPPSDSPSGRLEPARDSHDRLLNLGLSGCGDQGRRA